MKDIQPVDKTAADDLRMLLTRPPGLDIKTTEVTRIMEIMTWLKVISDDGVLPDQAVKLGGADVE